MSRKIQKNDIFIKYTKHKKEKRILYKKEKKNRENYLKKYLCYNINGIIFL